VAGRTWRRVDLEPDDGEAGVGIDDEAAAAHPTGLVLDAVCISRSGEEVAAETRKRKEKA
jgi:hypothetical protein